MKDRTVHIQFQQHITTTILHLVFSKYFDLDVTTNHSFSNFTVALPVNVNYWKKGKNQIGLASHYQFFQ